MELIQLKVTEENRLYYYFTITIENTNWWGKKTTQNYNLYKQKTKTQSRFISSGDTVFRKWLDLDDSINAILSKENKFYKR